MPGKKKTSKKKVAKKKVAAKPEAKPEVAVSEKAGYLQRLHDFKAAQVMAFRKRFPR